MASVNLSKQTVNLSKGEKVNLSKKSEGLKNVMIALGWDPVDKSGYTEEERVVKPGFIGKLFGKQEHTVKVKVPNGTSTQDIDCDAWIGLLRNGKFHDYSDVIYYGAREFYCNGTRVVYHHGDNLTGEGDGDDEQITINLKDLPDVYDSIVIGVTIYKGYERGQSFGDIKNTFVRVVDENDNFEICRFNQSEMAENKDSITFIAGKMYKDKGEWQFTAVGKGTNDKTIRDAIDHYRYE